MQRCNDATMQRLIYVKKIKKQVHLMFFTLFVTYWHVEFAIMLFVKVLRALMLLFL